MKRLEDQADHGALVKGGHDDRAAQDFAFTLRNYVTSELMPSNRTVYDRRAGPAFERRTGRPPASPADIRSAMDGDSYYRFYLSARRTSQELIWASVIPAVERAGERPLAAPAGGTLDLDPATEPPRYAQAIDIHCMPGGYGVEAPAIGAVYDRGVYLYMSGLMGPLNDAVGQLAAAYLQRTRPDFRPVRILDLGCGVGHATLPYVARYPEAEVHGLDAGAGLLGYAHARAESLGIKAHFRQGNAERTPYADASFDLVASHIFLHETSTRALPAILEECHRLLRPGGVMLHVDQPRFDDTDSYATFLQENETFYNNEPFWRQYRRTDLGALAAAAGFAPDDIHHDVLSAAVVQQSQNNQRLAPESDAGRKRGFSVLLAVKR